MCHFYHRSRALATPTRRCYHLAQGIHEHTKRFPTPVTPGAGDNHPGHHSLLLHGLPDRPADKGGDSIANRNAHPHHHQPSQPYYHLKPIPQLHFPAHLDKSTHFNRNPLPNPNRNCPTNRYRHPASTPNEHTTPDEHPYSHFNPHPEFHIPAIPHQHIHSNSGGSPSHRNPLSDSLTRILIFRVQYPHQYDITRLT